MNNLMKRGSHQMLAWRRFVGKNFATASESERKREIPSYDSVLSRRQLEARRTIVVQVSSEKSFPELYNYCSTFGNIIGAHHYRLTHEDDLHYILLEYASIEEAAAAIDSSGSNEELTAVPVRSPFLWFKATGKRGVKSANQVSTKTIAALNTIEGTRVLDNSELNTILHTATNIEQQIGLLHEHTQLNDLGIRMRFLAALQVQQTVSGMFPDANAQPFGSSVNGFGKMGCDLDLILRFDRQQTEAEKTLRNQARLIFHTKENLSNGRSQTQRQMESIGDMLQLFLPGVYHVRRILQARVPIIKYHHDHLNLEIDLSMSNLTGFYMSELLYMFGELDERVRPLTFCIRRWAHTCGLTNPSPGRWITNFSLTCLVVFFLQQMKQPILPTINTLVKSAVKEDIRITEDGINCTFGRDFERIGFRSRNTSQLHELLLQFFEFYSQFDFNNRAISLNEGRGIAKPDHSALYIVNPLEQVLNVSKNISLEECERLRVEVRNAAWVLESEVENTALTDKEKLETPWGLLNLFKSPEKTIIRPNMFFKPRMVEVSDLFETVAGTAATPSSTATFKNNHVKQQIQKIKAQARSDLKQMHESVENGATKGRRTR